MKFLLSTQAGQQFPQRFDSQQSRGPFGLRPFYSEQQEGLSLLGFIVAEGTVQNNAGVGSLSLRCLRLLLGSAWSESQPLKPLQLRTLGLPERLENRLEGLTNRYF